MARMWTPSAIRRGIGQMMCLLAAYIMLGQAPHIFNVLQVAGREDSRRSTSFHWTSQNTARSSRFSDSPGGPFVSHHQTWSQTITMCVAVMIVPAVALLARPSSGRRMARSCHQVLQRWAGWAKRCRVIRCSHGHDDNAHTHDHDHNHGPDDDGAALKASHTDHGHGHDSEPGHDHHEHGDGHRVDKHEDDDAHGHESDQGSGHGCCGHGHGHGHSHSHGRIPQWVPFSGGIQRVVRFLRRKKPMAVATLIFCISLLPWKHSIMRSVGPTSVFLVFGIPALCDMLAHFELDIHVLMTAAAFASVAIGHAHEGATLLVLFALSEALEEHVSLRARASLNALSKMSPETAHCLPTDASNLGSAELATDVAASRLVAGDRILVRAGEIVPVDGKVLDGVSQVKLSHLTGEPLPQSVSQGEMVMSGALNTDGALLLQVERPASESTVQRIVRLTASAGASRPKLVTLLDAVASRWSYAVMVSSVVIATLPPLLWGSSWSSSLYRSLVWLITASPCALILATPLVYVSGLSLAASNGVLLKGGRTLDALASATGFAFDKTGTITSGQPTLQNVQSVSTAHTSKSGALAIASALGRLSVHPVSRALVDAAPLDAQAAQVLEFQMAPGDGVSGVISLQGQDVPLHAALGRPSFVAQHLETKLCANDLAELLRKLATNVGEGKVSAALCVSGANTEPEAWLLEFEDCVKSSASEALHAVAKNGPIFMLTGDRQENAILVASAVEGPNCTFQEVHANLRPEGKLAKVRELDSKLRISATQGNSLRSRVLSTLGVSQGGLVMVGDGVNDAPALAAATVGISLAAQAEGALPTNAVEGSDILILRQRADPGGDADLLRVQWILTVARKAQGIVRQNLFLALVSISTASIASIAADLPLWLGVILHEGTTMLVALNSLRLLSQVKRPQER